VRSCQRLKIFSESEGLLKRRNGSGTPYQDPKEEEKLPQGQLSLEAAGTAQAGKVVRWWGYGGFAFGAPYLHRFMPRPTSRRSKRLFAFSLSTLRGAKSVALAGGVSPP